MMWHQLGRSLTLFTAPLLFATPAGADVYVDPDDYSCAEYVKHQELGDLRTTLVVNAKSGLRRFSSHWRSNSNSPQITANWHGKDFGLGNLGIRYNSIESIVKVRLEIGICNGNQNICGPSMHYATNFKETKESVSANANWGVVSAIGRRFGKLYFQVQDETGKVIREDKMEISTLLAVEQEMSRLMSAVEAKSVDFQNQCRH